MDNPDEWDILQLREVVVRECGYASKRLAAFDVLVESYRQTPAYRAAQDRRLELMRSLREEEQGGTT